MKNLSVIALAFVLAFALTALFISTVRAQTYSANTATVTGTGTTRVMSSTTSTTTPGLPNTGEGGARFLR